MDPIDSKTIIVTGANSGIGFECAKELCRGGCDVVVSVRDSLKGDKTIASIKTEVPDARIMYIVMEMSEPASIKEFVNKFHETGKPLNVLINNAGCLQDFYNPTREVAQNDQTLELTMTVNCVGPFLLTNLLLEDLKATGTTAVPSRIVNVSSMIVTIERESLTPFYIDDLMLAKPGKYKGGGQAYRCSKVALNLWSNELAKRLQGSNITINTLCPGFIPATSLARNAPQTLKTSFIMWMLDTFLGRWLVNTKPCEVGASRVVEMALDEKFDGSNGKFYKDGKPHQEPDDVLNVTNQEKIWELCTRFSGLENKN